jgi:hypothetical protein
LTLTAEAHRGGARARAGAGRHHLPARKIDPDEHHARGVERAAGGGLVVTLFLTALLQWQNGWFVSLIFIACMVSLIASLVAFIRDINLSLRALKLELGDDREPKGGDAI